MYKKSMQAHFLCFLIGILNLYLQNLNEIIQKLLKLLKVISLKNKMRPKIAIIGSGISGLTSAYMLNDDFDIHLFEANDYLGGHTCTIDIDEKGKTLSLDVGFIVFNHKTYPHFTQLLRKEKVVAKKSEMSFSYESPDKKICFNGHNLFTLLADPNARYSARFYSFILEILRFNKVAKKSIKTKTLENKTVHEFLSQFHFSNTFIKFYIQPLAASVWSSQPSQILYFPAEFFLGFLENHGLLNLVFRPQWYVVNGGSKSYIQAMTKNFINKIHLNLPIRSISREPQGVVLHTDSGSISFDKVVLATHSDQALKLIKNPTENEINILSNIPYQSNQVILHTDSSVLPRIKKCWASWNFSDNSNNQCSLTYYMNRLQSIKSDIDYCVSVNLEEKIDNNKIINKFTFHHPVYSKKAILSQTKINDINGKNNTFFCGAYWGYGFHEDGVVSALKTCAIIKEFYAQ